LDFTTLKSIQTVYPKYIKQYKDILLDPNSDVETKVDTIVQSLNRVSANEQQLVNNWNQVMQWAMNDGLDAAVSTQIAALEASGYFDSLLTSLFNSELGTETLATASQDIKGAINEVKGVADSNTSALADIVTVNNHSVTYTYNPDGSVQSTTEKDGSNNTIKTVTYTYNAVGDVATSVTVMNGKTVTTTYNYDANANISSTSNVIS
jgi:hypothetical protein